MGILHLLSHAFNGKERFCLSLWRGYLCVSPCI